MKTEVVIVGGGLTGGMLAIGLAQAGIPVVVIDQQAPTSLVDATADGRTTSVAYGSKRIFSSLGVWDALAAVAEPILNIRIFEENSPHAVYYDHRQVGDHPMGYIVENTTLRQAIFQRAQQLANLTWKAPCNIAEIKRDAYGVTITLEGGEVLHTPLLVGADGRQSKIRQQMGFATKEWTYPQEAIVCHIYHEKPHENSAWEVFFAHGPLAILPMRLCPKTKRFRSGVVWTQSPQEAKRLMELDGKAFSAKLTEAFPFYNALELIGKRWSYPLSAMWVKKYADHRVVLVGDAAHCVHPVAGQGVNLGWRDAAVLADVIIEMRKLGMDIGSSVVLKRYEKARKLDNLAILGMTDGMVQLFSNDSAVLRFLRTAGLSGVNQLPPLKRFFMRRGMGLSKQPYRNQGDHS